MHLMNAPAWVRVRAQTHYNYPISILPQIAPRETYRPARAAVQREDAHESDEPSRHMRIHQNRIFPCPDRPRKKQAH
jgi:hypothetical protein